MQYLGAMRNQKILNTYYGRLVRSLKFMTFYAAGWNTLRKAEKSKFI